MSVSDELRKALAADPRTKVAIGKLTSIHPVNLRQFQAGTRKLSLDDVEKLAAVLGKQTTIRNTPKKSR